MEQLQARAERADVNNFLLQDPPPPPPPSSDDQMLQPSVNFVVYNQILFSGLESLFPESSVEQGLEAMFDMDSFSHNEEIVRF